MNAHIKKSVFILFFVLCVPLFVFAAFPDTPNTTPPDNGTIGTAINTGGTGQVKNGDLSVNAFSAVLTSYFAQKLGVGRTPSLFTTLDVNPTVTVTSDLKNIQSGITYNGGSPMANYYGAYIAAPTGSGTITNKYALVTEPTAGKVGIGTVTPVSQLSVAGGIQVGDDTSTCTNTNVGTMRWHSLAFETCNGTAWVPVAPVLASNIVSCNTGQLCGLAMWESIMSWDGTRSYRCVMASGPVHDYYNCDGGYHTIFVGSYWSYFVVPSIRNPWDAFSCDAGYTFAAITYNNAYPVSPYTQTSGIASCLKQ